MARHPSLPSRAVAFLVAIACACVLAGCGTTNTRDETAGWSAQKIYTEAREEMRAGGWDKAIKLLESLESKYPFGRYAQQAQMDIAYSYWKNNDLTSAVAACDRFIKLYPNHDNLDYVYYLRGLILFNENLGLLGRVSRQDPTERDNRGLRESFDTLKILVTRWPESKYAEDARLRLKYLINALAQYEVHVARYYMRRGAHLAAANRAQFAIATYPNAPAQEEALYILVSAYDAMGMADLRDDARRVLDRTYPNSEIVRNKGPKNNDPWWKIW
ncbi:MAG: outer membrane protein assembly factor BamD [Burkholderiales bacterium]|nr:outer membrane protein assembly factor BamD [Burkholderiales bacterium]